MGIRPWQGGFRSHRAAQLAGRDALDDFLNDLAVDVAQSRASE